MLKRICLGFVLKMLWGNQLFAGPTINANATPDSIDSVGGHGEAFSNSGMAALSDISALRLNPAMMTALTSYQVAGTVHWPKATRNYYQIGVVDPTSSPGFAAGVLVTNPTQKLPDPKKDQVKFSEKLAAGEDLAERRLTFGIAQAFSKLSLGINVTHAEGYELKEAAWEKISGNAAGGGVAALLSPAIRIGASVENLVNGEKIKNLAPKTTRYGVAFLWGEGAVTTQLDYKERARISKEIDLGLNSPERSMTLSATAMIQNSLRLILSVGQTSDEKPRQFGGAGLAVVNNGFTLAYHVAKKDFAQSVLHQAASIGLDVRM